MFDFKSVSKAVSVKDAANFYGIKVSKDGMCNCIFHKDRHPSMKVDSRYYCFSCQRTGDVIDFISQLFSINTKDAYLKLRTTSELIIVLIKLTSLLSNLNNQLIIAIHTILSIIVALRCSYNLKKPYAKMNQLQ